MFIWSKGKPKTFNPIKIPCKYPEDKGKCLDSTFKKSDEKGRAAKSEGKRIPVKETKIKGNIWYFPVGSHHSTKDEIAYQHPAIFPEQLAHDHIISWSNEKDLIFDPFMGSGTTAKMSMLTYRRFIGIEKDKEYYYLTLKRLNIYKNRLF